MSLRTDGRTKGWTKIKRNIQQPPPPRQKRGVKILCVAAELKNRGQKSICGHKKGGQYSMSHWKIGVKILCVVLKRGSKMLVRQWKLKWKKQGSKFYVAKAGRVKILWKLKYGGQNSIFFSWNPWSKFYVPWKGGSKFYIFSQCLEKGGQNRGAYQPTSLKGCPPRAKPPPPTRSPPPPPTTSSLHPHPLPTPRQHWNICVDVSL